MAVHCVASTGAAALSSVPWPEDRWEPRPVDICWCGADSTVLDQAALDDMPVSRPVGFTADLSL